MLFLLLFLLLLPFPSRAADKYRPCQSTSACLVFLHCDDEIENEVVLQDVTTPQDPPIELSNCANGTSYIHIAIKPRTATRWAIYVSSSLPIVAGIRISFGANSIQFANDTSAKVTVETWTRDVTVMPYSLMPTFSGRILLEDLKMIWLDHFDASEISTNMESPNSTWSASPKPLVSFWKAVRDNTPKCDGPITDACTGKYPVTCKKLVPTSWNVPCELKLWVNREDQYTKEDNWRALAGIECELSWKEVEENYDDSSYLDDRELICAASKPVACLRQEVKNMCEEGCDKFNITKRKVTCDAKFWLNIEGTFTNDWRLVKEMVCGNETWNWRPEDSDEQLPFKQQKLACSFDAPQKYKTAFYAAVIGVPTVTVIICVIVIVMCCLTSNRKKKGQKKKRRRSRNSDTKTELTKTDMDNFEVSSLGVKMKKKKFDTWSWSREQKKASESSSNISSTGQLESSGEEDKGKIPESSRKKCPPLEEQRGLL